MDTNVFVAAGFNSRSAAARILAAVREGHFQLVWNKPTRREIETILRRIPGLEWARVAALFRPEGEFTGPVDPDAFVMIEDRDDRKFVALSAAAQTPLVTNDNDVLAQRRAVGVEILTPSALVARERDWTIEAEIVRGAHPRALRGSRF
jgi:predicted nucleic acid-binding protein